MLTNKQKAFVNAYSNNVASVPVERVEEFLERYLNNDNVEYSEDYTSIVDAWGMWTDALAWSDKQKTESVEQIMWERRSNVWAGLNTIHELFPVITMLQASLDGDKPMDKYQVKNVLDACKTILLYGGGMIEDWLFLEEKQNETE